MYLEVCDSVYAFRPRLINPFQMYSESMTAILRSLMLKGPVQGLTFTAELQPWRKPDGQMYVLTFCDSTFSVQFRPFIATGTCRRSKTTLCVSLLVL